MAKAGTDDAAVGEEEDGVERRPISFEQQPRREEGSAEKAMGTRGDLGTPAVLR
jgi:hypothetical protein